MITVLFCCNIFLVKKLWKFECAVCDSMATFILSFVVFFLLIFQGSFNQHKMFLPEGMDYNKVLKSLSKELKQAEV